MKKKVEILAPAGSFDSMKAAVAAGADAVYMGGSRFGARAYAENPDETGMLEAINYVHLHGRQLYMTVNTLVKEDEMDDLYDYLLPYYQAGLDAVIVQDMGVFSYIREHFPDLPVHASTQMTITGPAIARISIVLPLPFFPLKPYIFPDSILRLTSSRISIPLIFLDTFFNSIYILTPPTENLFFLNI